MFGRYGYHVSLGLHRHSDFHWANVGNGGPIKLIASHHATEAGVDVSKPIRTRGSIRKSRPDTVDRALMEKLLYAAVQAPTPPVSGTTPWALCVVEGVKGLASYGPRDKQDAHDRQPE